MGSVGDEGAEKPHAVCVPYPAQGHITPMMKVAKLLHARGFHITFVNTHYNRRRLLKARGPSALDGLPGFRFHSIPDGLLPPSDADTTQHIPSLCKSTMTTCLPPFRDLLARLNASADVPPVSCIVSDGVMTFTLDAAEELAVPEVLLWTTSACGFMGYLHYREVVDKGLLPVKDDGGGLSNGYLDTAVGWLSGMPNVRLRDLPSFVRTSSPDDKFMVEFAFHETGRASRAAALILNTFEDLEHTVLGALAAVLPPLYPIGPLSTMLISSESRAPAAGSTDDDSLPLAAALGSNLWKEDAACLEWLEGRAAAAASVVYVNFGSIAVMSKEQLVEFAWGLAASGKEFLWIIRPDLVEGDSAVLPAEFLEETKERGLLASWCPQEEVLGHPAVGGFLTHCGWNSVLESICGGVPMLCWPFFAEQPTNCRYACEEWGVGVEIDADAGRAVVAALIGELMDGARGEEMRRRARRWRQSAADAAGPRGSSAVRFDQLVEDVLLARGRGARR